MSIIKKVFFLSLLILCLSLLIWGVYRISFNKPGTATDNKNNTANNAPGSAPAPKTDNAIFPITDEAVIAPTLTSDENGIKYYARTSGKVYQIGLDGTNKTTIADQELRGLSDALWSPDKSKVITKFIKPGGDVQFYFYDYNTKKASPIKSNVDEIAWQANSSKIFYKYYDSTNQERSLNVSDPDGSDWKKLADISYRNISIAQVPQSGLVSFWNKPDSYMETTFETIPAIGGERKTILNGKFGADYLWSPNGNNVLTGHSESRTSSKMQLATINFNGGEYKNLGVPTFISKCAWSKDNKTIYYALPLGIPNSAILPNEYAEGKFTTSDTFWKINTTNGQTTRLVDTDKISQKFDATNLFLNSDESMIFFVNKIDGKLYRINL